ncbi:MAG: LAGLIDADG family homing endonuclease [Promethearchaeota archaeon]
MEPKENLTENGFYYKKKGYSTLDLIRDLSKVLGSLSNASSSLGYGKTYFSDLKVRIRNPNIRGYNPNYLFSERNLFNFSRNIIKNVPDKSLICIGFILKYISFNTNMKLYPNQQYEVGLKYNFFNKINSLDKAYWLGFLYADGSVTYRYKGKPWYLISLELSSKDKNQLVKFCDIIGLNHIDMIKSRFRIRKYGYQLKYYKMVYVRFRCKPMVEDLMSIGFSSSKSERKTLPNNLEKKKELLLAFLLGYYDGDGNAKSTRITSSSKRFLEELKNIFQIKFQIKKQYEKGKKSKFGDIIATKPHWRLTLGAKLFNQMMENYKQSLSRKRKFFKERN